MSTGFRIFRTVFGSHLYGTNTPQSDFDFKHVFVPSGRDILLGQVNHSNSSARAKGEFEKNAAGETEEEGFSLQRYLHLLSEGQTVSLDMLFAPISFHAEAAHPIWHEIVANRHRLITKRSAAFVGYCRQQANKYGIKGSRVAAAKAALEVITAMVAKTPRGRLDEHEDIAMALVAAHEHCEIELIEQPNGMQLAHLAVCGRKLSFRQPVKESLKVIRLLVDTYGGRALMAESNQGVDWKALSHAVRVGHEAIELLATEKITFPLPYAKDILDIKLGRIPYPDVAETIEQLLEEVERCSQTSSLPDRADIPFIQELVIAAHRMQVGS
jgi:hypothetical protein